jgi:hypothetical protein
MFVACAFLALSGRGRGQERSVPEQIVDWQLDFALFPLNGKRFRIAIRQSRNLNNIRGGKREEINNHQCSCTFPWWLGVRCGAVGDDLVFGKSGVHDSAAQ